LEILNVCLLTIWFCPFVGESEDKSEEDMAIERVQSLLLRGNRKEAVEEAIASKDFATALLVASMCDPETYKRTAKTYSENVFVGGSPMHTIGLLFSGSSIPSSSYGKRADFWGISSSELKLTWKKHLAAIISNRIVGWDRVVVSLGDRLGEIGDFQGSHFCYMVCGCPVTNPMDHNTRVALLGCNHGADCNVTLMNREAIDAYDRTEAYEWAKRRGNKNATIKSFQPFKVIFAKLLTDYGFEDEARLCVLGIRQCTDIKSSTKHPFSGLTPRVFNEPEMLASLLGDLESRLDLLDSFNEQPIINEDSFAEENRDIVNSTLNQTDVDATFVTAASNLMDNPDFAVTPEKDLPKFKSEIEPTLQEPTKDKMTFLVAPFTVQQAEDKPPAKSSIPPTQPVDKPLSMPPTVPKAMAPTGFVRHQPQSAPQTPIEKVQKDENLSKNLPPMQTRTAAVTPTETKKLIEKAPNTAPSIMMGKKNEPKSGKKKQAPSSSERTKSGSWLGGLRSMMLKRLNPDAIECKLPDNEEKPYYDEKRKVWVFPGDDPDELVKPIAPPPMVPAADSKPKPEELQSEKPKDPLAAMMAPPTRRPAALRRPGASSGMTMSSPGMPGMSSSLAGSAPPPFAVFTPAKKDDKKEDK
jgi:hypothetical protein